LQRRLHLLVTSALAGAAASSVAYAQEPAPSRPDNVLEEIVVTAEKREQSIQDVPVAVSAFTDETREVLGIQNAQDLVNFTPGINYNTGNDRLTMRGIGRLTNNRSSEGGVAMYNDGFYTSSVYSFSKSTLFIDRTEVLRGPQGTLYGRNSIGGAMNIISKRPTEEFYAEVRGRAENFDTYAAEAAISGPLWGGIRGRLAGSWLDQGEGYFTNLTDGRTEGGRGDIYLYEVQLEGEMADGQFEWWAKYEKSKTDALGRGAGGRQGVQWGLRNTSTVLSNGATPSSGWANLFNTSPLPSSICDLCFDTDTPNQIDIESETYTFHATLHLENFDIRYVTGKTWYHYQLQTDVDGTSNSTPFTLFPTSPGAPGTATGAGQIIPTGGATFFPRLENQYDEEPLWFSNELNFASTHDGPVQWLAGLYQYREESNYTPVDARVVDDARFEAPINILAPTGAVIPNPNRTYAIGTAKTRSESYAAFGQVDWQVADAWKLTAGLRYTRDEKTAVEGARLICYMGVSAACPPVYSRLFNRPIDFTPVAVATGTQIDPSVTTPIFTDPATGIRSRVLQNEWDGWGGTLGVDWQPDRDTLVYGKYTRGYKAGGFNSATTTLVPEVTTQKEIVDAYEIGAKKTFMGTLQVNASAFYYEYGDIQAVLSQFDPILNSNQARYVNLPEATIKGVELETIWQPIYNLQLLFNYSYLDGEIGEGCCFEDPDDPLAQVPGAQPVAGQEVRSATTGLITSRPQSLAGQSLSGITPHRVTVNANYTWELDPGDLTASLSYFWRDETYHSVFNRYYNKTKAYDQVDARLLFNDSDDRFTVIGFVRNVFDTRGQVVMGGTRLTNAGPNLGYINQDVSFIAPRTYGLELQYRFR
jgi:iron complex outermembrane receptor protein